VVAEAAYAPRRAGGRWNTGLDAVAAALRQADTALMLNPNDEECVAPLLRRRRGALYSEHGAFGAGDDFAPWVRRARTRPAAAEPLLPFLATKPYRQAAKRRTEHRKDAARNFGIPAAPPWLLAVGMMRPGDKLDSYRLLART